MKKYIFCVNIQGVSVSLKTNSTNYIEYLNNYISPIGIEESIDADINVYIDLEESIFTHRQYGIFYEPDDLKRIGRRVLLNDNDVICDGFNQLNSLKCRCSYNDKTQIYGHLNLNKSEYLLKRMYQQIVRKRKYIEYKFDVYATLTYYMIYYPILYALEKNNIHPLHASAILYKDHGIVIPGLPGVGKSTLSFAFLAEKNAKFISDNILLYDKSSVYSFFEPLKLDKNAMTLININKDVFVNIGSDSYYDREAYRVNMSSSLDSVRPEILLIPVRSNKTVLTPISAQQATQFSIDFNNIAGEINSYLSYSSIQNLNRNERLAENRIESLLELCNSMKCFILNIESGRQLDDVIKHIDSSLDL